MVAGTLATGGGHGGSAVVDTFEMTRGVHAAQFALRSADRAGTLPYVGVVGAGFDATREQFAYESAEGWVLKPCSGTLYHGGEVSEWVGMPSEGELKQGDVIVSCPTTSPTRPASAVDPGWCRMHRRWFWTWRRAAWRCMSTGGGWA